MQAPFTPLLTLLHQLLEEQGCSNPQPPFSQMPDDAAHIAVLQKANFTNVKVPAMFKLQSDLLNLLLKCTDVCLPKSERQSWIQLQ
jgi:hypothetical protein